VRSWKHAIDFVIDGKIFGAQLGSAAHERLRTALAVLNNFWCSIRGTQNTNASERDADRSEHF
jgi:hypothetical protein